MVSRIECLGNRGRGEKLVNPTAAGWLMTVNGEEISSMSPDARVRDTLGVYTTLRQHTRGI
jgi:hypothetical protein